MLKLHIENLKNIRSVKLELPFNKGLYAITGINGIGKSTIFSALSKIVYRGALQNYFKNDGDQSTKITYSLNGRDNVWIKKFGWQRENPEESYEIFLNGIYEGSLIYGNRFTDAHVSRLNSINRISLNDLCDADDFVKNNLGLILKNNEKYYSVLKKVKSKRTAELLGFSGIPYAMEDHGKLIHQHKMSSGEFLLIGLLHYINLRIIYNERHNNNKECVILLDEIELALHPSAQERLAVFLNKISSQYGFTIYFATHSIQILNHIRPEKIFHLDQGIGKTIEVINPCYPAYASRSLYTADGFDFLFLVEDILSKTILEKIIKDKHLNQSRLIKVIPTGGWEKTLELHNEFNTSKLAGNKCRIVSILDGDMKDECERKYPRDSQYGILEKNFLPILSIEKYLKNKLITDPDNNFAKNLGDNIFKVRSIYEIIESYTQQTSSKNDNNGKNLYLVLKRCAEEQGVTVESFQKHICDIVFDFENFNGLQAHIEKICKS